MPILSKFARNQSLEPMEECCISPSRDEFNRLSRTVTNSYHDLKEDQVCNFNTSCNNNKKSPTTDAPPNTPRKHTERPPSIIDQNQAYYKLEMKSSDSESDDNFKIITDSCDKETESQYDTRSSPSLYKHFPITISSTEDETYEESPLLVFDYDTVKSYRPPPLPIVDGNMPVPRITDNVLKYGDFHTAEISFPSLEALCCPKDIQLSREPEPREPEPSDQEIGLECISWLLALMEPVFNDSEASKAIVVKNKQKNKTVKAQSAHVSFSMTKELNPLKREWIISRYKIYLAQIESALKQKEQRPVIASATVGPNENAVVPGNPLVVFDSGLHSRMSFQQQQNTVIIDINQVIGNQGDALVTIQGTYARVPFRIVNGLHSLKTNAFDTVVLSVKRVKGWANLLSPNRWSSTNLSSPLQILRKMNSKRHGSLSVVVQPVKMVLPTEKCLAISSYQVKDEFIGHFKNTSQMTRRKKQMVRTYLRVQNVAINQALLGPFRRAGFLDSGINYHKEASLAGAARRKQPHISVAVKSEPSSPKDCGGANAKQAIIPSTKALTVNIENIKLYQSKVVKSVSQPCLKYHENLKPVFKNHKRTLNHKVEQTIQMHERGDFAIPSNFDKPIHGKCVLQKKGTGRYYEQGCGENVLSVKCPKTADSQAVESESSSKKIPMEEPENPFEKLLLKCNPRSQMLNPLNGICRKIFILAEKFIPATEV